MFNSNAIIILALAICVASDPIRQKPLRTKALARQVEQPTPAPVGYPAAGVTPQIPFELPTETEKPDVAAKQPDDVYGPPELEAKQPVGRNLGALQPAEVYGQPDMVVAQQPDQVYGPAGFETVQPAVEVEVEPEIIREITEEDEEEAAADAEAAVEALDEADEILVDEDEAVISISSAYEQPARLVYKNAAQNRQILKPVPARLRMAKVYRPVNIIYTARSQNFQGTK